MKTLLFICTVLFASCSSEDDPKPQDSCEVLEWRLQSAQKAITEHQAKGSAGNPEAWKAELKKLTAERDKLQGEFTVRRCL